MNDPRPDAELRERFQQLRSEDRAAAPDFAVMFEQARAEAAAGGAAEVGVAHPVRPRGFQRVARSRWMWAGGSVAAAAAVAALLLFHPGARADREFVRTVREFAESTRWRSPTDMLLDLPGSEIMRSIPRVGSPSWTGAAGTPRRLRS